ncbi:MAG: hypothetical protein AAFQ07_16960 [Chloroflexota bacterium]
MKYDASFLIYINHEGDLVDINQSIRENVEEIEWRSISIGSTSKNHIDMSKNQLYDSKLVNDKGGYRYYKFVIMVIPRRDLVSEDEMKEQAQFAKELLDSLAANGIVSVLDKRDVADFIENMS